MNSDFHILSFPASCLEDISQLKNIAEAYSLVHNKHSHIIICGAFHATHKKIIAFAHAIHSHKRNKIAEVLDEIKKTHMLALEDLFTHDADYENDGEIDAVNDNEKYFFFTQHIDAIIQKIHTLFYGISLIKEISERTIFLLDTYASQLSARLIQACVFCAYGIDITIIMSEHSENTTLDTTMSDICSDENSILPIPSSHNQQHTILTKIITHHTKALHIWTNQGGVMTANKTIVPTAFPIRHIDYTIALEIGYLGGKILHPSIIQTLKEYDIPISVYAIQSPKIPSSIIQHIPLKEYIDDVFTITERDNISVLTIKSTQMFDTHGYLEKIFKVFSHFTIPVETLSSSEISVTLTFPSKYYSETFKTALTHLGSIEFLTEQTIISIIGNRVWKNPTTIAKVLGALEGYTLNMLSLGQSGSNLNLVCDTEHNREIIRHLHRVLFE